MHPHHANWGQIGGLIADGTAWSVAKAKERVAGGEAGGYAAVPEASVIDFVYKNHVVYTTNPFLYLKNDSR